MSIYELKPKFQQLLRPLVRRLYARGVTANQVTLFACLISVCFGIGFALAPHCARTFILLPLWLFLRMALNAADGMLAREFGQKSRLGGYLNELTDVIADAALYLPFALIAPFGPLVIGCFIFFAALTEFCGVLGRYMATAAAMTARSAKATAPLSSVPWRCGTHWRGSCPRGCCG